MAEVSDWIKLSLAKDVGEATLRYIIKRFGSPTEVFKTPARDLREIVNDSIARSIKEAEKINVEHHLRVMEKLGVKLITFNDPQYPANLKDIAELPPMLYVRGELLESDTQSIAIIGSRRATTYGKFIAEQFAYELAVQGLTIVSGMARGIDSAAHKGALKTGGRTIAVLGCGVDVVYPPENKGLMHEIIQHGAVISEFPLSTKPLAGNFPVRNRLISGLSKAVVVVEARSRSGVFSTVEWALDQAKEVFAVPGNITSEASKGANRLIMDGAKPVMSSRDILDFLGIETKDIKRAEIKLQGDEEKVFDNLTYEPRHIDELQEVLSIPVSKLSGILLSLELKGIVKQLPGRHFVKNV